MDAIMCPKCGGGAFLSEEELIKILENTKPLTAVIRAVYQCRACAEKFSRLIHDALEGRKPTNSSAPVNYSAQSPDEDSAAEGLKFF
jgi:Zn-finger nucleic acid-binding protein